MRRPTGVQSAVIALDRHRRLSKAAKKQMHYQGVTTSELLVIMSMQVMLCPETITEAEWKLAEGIEHEPGGD